MFSSTLNYLRNLSPQFCTELLEELKLELLKQTAKFMNYKMDSTLKYTTLPKSKKDILRQNVIYYGVDFSDRETSTYVIENSWDLTVFYSLLHYFICFKLEIVQRQILILRQLQTKEKNVSSWSENS